MFTVVLSVALWAMGATAVGQVADVPPPPARWVTDTVSLLSPAARNALDARLESYERETGHQVVVWIGATVGSTPLAEFATRTFEKWRPGRKGLDDGLLVIVLRDDRKIAIEVGYGLEDRVPDAIAHRVIDEVMVPRLRKGDADGALSAGVDALLGAIEGRAFEPKQPGAAPSAEEPPRPSKGTLLLYGLLALGFLLLFITHPSLALNFLFIVMSGRGGPGGGSRGGFAGGGGRSGGGGARGSW